MPKRRRSKTTGRGAQLKGAHAAVDMGSSGPMSELAPCIGRAQFRDEATAQRRAKLYGDEAYECPWCRKWHVRKIGTIIEEVSRWKRMV